ncbi:PadR family transcriptional regulator [Jatrophihabitans telluris]|uniref:PadR family transcriptional regulator n=1 Tax=Jatrophihabitans telluris TaxID=2038343 RepID=A0ABY4R258_9ACTN|nr:PadR family transcriptional regulator [Jatrophihabitans telluris]UQX89900.1 PadR family transcriptional regulator [Jatrophihabitans telluris]
MSVKHGLLALLDRGPLHGYQLRTEFEESTGSTWPLNIGQVYSTLARLERDGFIAEVDGPAYDGSTRDGQRLYAITEAGRVELGRWFSTPVSADPARSELAIKLALAARTPGVDITALVQIQRTATVRSLQDYTRARERAGDDLSWQLVADLLIFNAEAEIRWLDHCETRVARAAAAGAPSAPQPSGASARQPSTATAQRAGRSVR